MRLLAGALRRGVFEDRFGRFGFGRIDEGTGIDHDRVGVGAHRRSSQPAGPSVAIITSESTRFLAQPRLTNATPASARLRCTSMITLGRTASSVVDELQRQFVIETVQKRLYLLQIVLAFPAHAYLLVLELSVNLNFAALIASISGLILSFGMPARMAIIDEPSGRPAPFP